MPTSLPPGSSPDQPSASTGPPNAKPGQPSVSTSQASVSTSQPSSDLGAFAQLGAGGAADRVDWKLVLALFRRCLPYLLGQKRHLLRLALGWVVLALVIALPFLQMVDIFWAKLLSGAPLSRLQARLLWLSPDLALNAHAWTQAARMDALRRLVALGLALAALGGPAGAALIYYHLWILQRINQRLRADLYQRVQALGLRFHADHAIGDALYRLYQDSSMVTRLIELLFLRPIEALARILFALAVVGLWSPVLALLFVLTWPALLWLAGDFSPRLRAGFRRAREAASTLTSRIQETLAGIRVLKAYGAEPREQARFEAASSAAFDAAFAARSSLMGYGVLVFWVLGTATLSAIAWSAVLASGKAPTAVAAFGFSAFSLGLYNNVKSRFGDGAGSSSRLMGLWAQTQDVAIGLDRVFEVLDLEPEVRDAPGAQPMPPVQRGVEVRDVTFAYTAARPTLEQISLSAPVGTITAVVGPTGAGKSTLMALLLRLFDPDRGQVLIDGRDLRELTVASVRRGVAIALQENLLFATTVQENIRYAVPDASPEAVRQAAAIACADEFIAKLPAGYDTLLGERGARLSTGQRQRLTIARALLRDAPILLLDEPTASLDAETEHQLLGNLERWGRDRVLFLVTHRLSTIRRAHRIIFLQQGKLIEQGSHAELMQRPGGAYRRFVETEAMNLGASPEPPEPPAPLDPPEPPESPEPEAQQAQQPRRAAEVAP